jgi:hypothetical protein
VSVRATPYRNLRAVVCVGRLPDPTIVFAGPALLANVCNQSEHEALAARCLAAWPSLIREGGGLQPAGQGFTVTSHLGGRSPRGYEARCSRAGVPPTLGGAHNRNRSAGRSRR